MKKREKKRQKVKTREDERIEGLKGKEGAKRRTRDNTYTVRKEKKTSILRKRKREKQTK